MAPFLRRNSATPRAAFDGNPELQDVSTCDLPDKNVLSEEKSSFDSIADTISGDSSTTAATQSDAYHEVDSTPHSDKEETTFSPACSDKSSPKHCPEHDPRGFHTKILQGHCKRNIDFGPSLKPKRSTSPSSLLFDSSSSDENGTLTVLRDKVFSQDLSSTSSHLSSGFGGLDFISDDCFTCDI